MGVTVERKETVASKESVMSETNLGAARAKTVSVISPLVEDEILDWDVPPIQISTPSDTIRVRLRDAEPEPILDL